MWSSSPSRRRPGVDRGVHRPGRAPRGGPTRRRAPPRDHRQRLAEAVHVRHRRRAAVAQVVRPVLRAVRPVPVAGPQAGVLVGGPRLGAGPHEAEPGRHHQPLLRGGDGDVDAPLVHLVRARSRARRCSRPSAAPDDRRRRSRRRMAAMSLRTDVPVSTCTTKTALIVRSVSARSRCLDGGGIDRRPVGARASISISTPDNAAISPHTTANRPDSSTSTRSPRDSVLRDRHLPRAVTVGHGDERRRRRAGDAGQLLEDLVGDVEQLTRVDVGHRPVHGRQHPVGDHRRPGDRHHVTTVVQRSLHACTVSHPRGRSHIGSEPPWSPARVALTVTEATEGRLDSSDGGVAARPSP